MGYTTADLQTFDLILFAGGTFAAALVTGIALPLLLAGTWFGLWLYARLDEAGLARRSWACS